MATPVLRDVRLYRMDLPDHACPWGLRALRLLQAQHIPFEDHPLRSEADVVAFKAAHAVASTPQVFAGGERIGGYTDLAARLGVRPERDKVSYGPVVAVFATAALITLAVGGGVMVFMGQAICLLAMLKLMDVQAFAASFRKYDLLSQRWSAWGRLYPGVELLVGLGVLALPLPAAALALLGVTAMLLGLLGMVSVAKAVFLDKLALNCACIGGHARAPLGLVSFTENLTMTLMGLALLVL